MFHQQMVRQLLEETMRTSVLGRFITIHDQGRNRQGALYGSRNGSVDTIDLSAASDSVTWDLVKAIFPRPWVLLFGATRTSQVELPDGIRMKVKKFAPMGSALCFPVQSLIYLGMTYLAYLCHHHRKSVHDLRVEDVVDIFNDISPDYTMCSRWYESMSCYGDDIICDSRTTSDLIHILQSLNFSVNTDKSFTGADGFRESCGMFSLRGEDTSPLKFKLNHIDKGFDAAAIATFVSIINTAGDYKYRNLQRVMTHLVDILIPGHGIRFSNKREADTLSIYSRQPVNNHLQKRFFKGLFRDEVRCWKLISDSYTSKFWTYESYSYHMWNRATALKGDSDSFITPRRVGRKATIKWRWKPLY